MTPCPGRMPQLDSLKRRMIQDAVTSNVAPVGYRRPPPAPRRHLVRWVGAVTLVAGSVGLMGVGLAARLDVTAGPPMIALARPVLSHRRFTAPPPPDEAALVPRPTSSVSKTVDTALFPLAIRTVVVDAGHGGDDHGTRAPLGLLEKDVTLDIATRLRALLAGRGYAAVMTRAADQAVPLRRRTQIANDARGDVLVSIHLNWISSRETRGVETYYLGPTDDPRLERLSAYENANSGLRLADLRTLLDELYADARQNESARLAGAVQRSLLRTLRRFNPTLENRGVKTAPFVVLTTSQMPAILAEVSCLSNDAEASLLADESYRERIASALADGVADFARTRARDPQKGTDDEF